MAMIPNAASPALSAAATELPAVQVRVGPKDCPSPHSLANKLGRACWGCVWWLLFRPSPKVCHAWRRWWLRACGARIGRGAKVFPSVRIWAPWKLTVGDFATLSNDVDCYCVAPIRIGEHTTISQYAFLCTASHDISDPHMRLVAAPIVIEDQAWVCAGVYVAPGVTIGQGAVAAAAAVVTKDVPAWTVVGGNPATYLKPRQLRTATERGRPS